MLETAATIRFAAANVHISVVGRGAYLYGIRFHQVSSSRLPVLDDFREIQRRSVSKIMFSKRSSVSTKCCWPWFVFLRCRVRSGIGKQVTRPSLFCTCIAAPCRTLCYQYQALFLRYVIGRGSFVYGMGLSQISSSRLTVLEDFANSSPQRVGNYVINTKLYSYELLLLVVRICTV